MSFSTDDRRPPAECTTMAEVRQGVDALDRLLVTVLAERQRYMVAAATPPGSRTWSPR
jgi:isochorismate pyruvate lyase